MIDHLVISTIHRWHRLCLLSFEATAIMSRYSAKQDPRLKQKNCWYVIANRTDAAFYSTSGEQKLLLIDRLTNEDGRLAESELVSDKPGIGFSSAAGGLIHHRLDRRSNQHDQVAKEFARQIAMQLVEAYREKRFRDLVLVAEPHFLGLLKAAMPLSIQRAIKHEIAREYRQGSESELWSAITKAIEKKGASSIPSLL